MKKRYRLITLLSAGILFSGALASCGGNTSSQTSPTSPIVPPTTTVTSPSTPDTTPIPEKEVVVKFVYNNGDEDFILNKKAGEKIDEPVVPTYSNHTFVGWSIKSSSYSPYDFNSLLRGDLTLYAVWSANKVTVSFNTNGGTRVSSMSGYPGDTLDLPTTSKSNSTFVGWYLDKDLTNAYVLTVYPSTNTILYAKFTESVVSDTISVEWPTSYEYNISLVSSTYLKGEKVIFKINFAAGYDETRVVVKANDQVLVAQNGTYSFIANDDVIIDVSNLVLKKVTLTFHAGFNDADGEEITFVTQVEYGSNISRSIADGKFSRQGYVLEDFYETDKFINRCDFSVKIRKDMDFYAKWVEEEFTITYSNTFGAFNSNTATKVTYFDKPIKLQPLQNYPQGLEFVGWTLDGKVVDTIPSKIDHNIELVAKWDRWQMEMNFVTGDPDIILSPITGYYGDPLILPADPVREGFYFTGWYLDANYKIPLQFTTWPATDLPINVFARWSLEPEDSSRIYLEKSEGVEINYFDGAVPNNGYVPNGSTINMTIRVKTESGYSGTPIVMINGVVNTGKIDELGRYIYTFVVNSDTRVVFDGISQKKYSLIFHYNDGTEYTVEKLVGYDAYLTTGNMIEDPKRDGYAFSGWYLDQNCLVSAPLNTKIEGNMNLYAAWEIMTYTIRLQNAPSSDHVGNMIQYNINSPTIILGNAYREGHVFIGWFDSNGKQWTVVNPKSDIERRDLVLQAHYRVLTFNVNVYDLTGKMLLATYTDVAYNSPLRSFLDLTNLRVEGYSIVENRMYYDMNMTSQVNLLSDLVLDNVTIYAGTNKKSYFVTSEDQSGNGYIVKNATGTIIPPTQENVTKVLYDDEVTYILNKPLEETSTYKDRVYVIRDNGVKELLEVDSHNQFVLIVKTTNTIVIERCNKITMQLIDETTANNYLLDVSSSTTGFVNDELTVILNKAISKEHILYVGKMSGGVIDSHSLKEISLNKLNSIDLVLEDDMVLVVRDREVTTLTLDQSCIDIGLEIISGNSDMYVGNTITITFNMSDSQIKESGKKLYIRYGEETPREILVADIDDLGPSIVFKATNSNITLMLQD